MQNKTIACIELGSSRITVMIAARGVNNTINLIGTGECAYQGYMYGRFVEPEAVASAINTALATAENNSNFRIEKLYVGVPAEFSVVSVKDVVITLPARKKVNGSHVAALFDSGNTFSETAGYTLINRSPVYFYTDDNRSMLEPFGQVTSKLGGKISYILAERTFTDFMNAIFDNTHIAGIEYVSTALSEVLYLFGTEEREATIMLADIGHINSSVVICRGDGILHMNTFSRGGGFITAALTQGLGASYEVADLLKRRLVLTLGLNDSDKYDISVKDKTYSFAARSANPLTTDCIKELAEIVGRILNDYSNDLSEHLPLYITGGGISYLRGAKNIMSEILKRPVEIASAPQCLINKPENSQILGLVDMALNQEPDKPKFFLR